ncbi:uncharacterized protein HGUI_01799 [Hanseniaspora guilliermondii]|uniref:FAD-binding FR-type domain-containing protein n=1 Tax=Hanseniaspora guilliermondii TaxID=56406 RepID=A0A1L0CXN4_9ASCO|nr:uncharacterized protein HGUI_01799 [Hanseniaspora guilliermondii]
MLVFVKFFFFFVVVAAKVEFSKWENAKQISPFYACKVANTETAKYCELDAQYYYECQCDDVVAFGAMAYCAVENSVNLNDFVKYFNTECNALLTKKYDITKEDITQAYQNASKYVKTLSDFPNFNYTADIMRTPIKPSQSLYDLAHRTYYDFYENTSWGIIFGIIFLGFWLFYFLVFGLYQVLFKYMRYDVLINTKFKFKKYNYTLFTKIYNWLDFFKIPIDPNEFNLSKCIGIGASLIIFLVGVCWNYHSFEGNYFWSKRSSQISRYIGDRAGYLCMFPLSLSILLASRNNFLLWCTGWNLADMVFFHKFFGLSAMVLAAVHSIAYWINAVKTDYYTESYTDDYWISGVYAMVIGAAIIFLSNHRLVRKHYYEIFFVLHIVLAVVFVIGMWRHLNPLECAEYIIPFIGIWALERVFRLFRMFVVFGGFRKNKATLYVNEENLDENDMFIRLDIENYNKSLFKPKEGHFGFVYLGLPFSFWQSHPFTVVKIKDSDNFAILMKVKKGITMKLYKKFLKQGVKHMDLRVCIEGPYGCSESSFANKHDQLCVITTGIAIAGPLSHLSYHRASNSHDGELEPNVLHWGVKSFNVIRALEKELKTILLVKKMNIEVHIYCKNFVIENNIKPKNSETDSFKSSNSDLIATFEGKLNIVQGYMNSKDWVDLVFSENNSSLIMTCGLMSISYQVKKQYMENVIKNKTKTHVGFIDESQSW